MAQTAAQKAAAAALKQAQALLAKQKKSLSTLEAQKKTMDADKAALEKQIKEDAFYTQKVGTTGKTQAQLETAANALEVAKSIGGTIDPQTGYVVKPGTKSEVDPDGDGTPDKNKPKEISDATRDAFAMLTDLFASYGLESLAGEISEYMTSGLTASEALIKLKTNPTGAYAKRFAGNFTRVKNGLNAISEAEYVANEKSYAETLKAYGLGNMLSLNREDNYKKFADYIAGDVSPDEFKDRVKTVVTRVQNSDPTIKATLKNFYPEITDNDLVSYFLNPKENLPKLQEKVTASEIGAAALGAGGGLTTNVGTATELARYGIDQAAAREGYSTIAGILPEAKKLGDIYNQSGVKYAQAEAEAEVFKGNQDAATKRKRLASMERAAFSGSSGTGQSSLTRSTQGLL